MPAMKAIFRVETRPETRGNVFIVFPEQPSTGPAMVEIYDPREGHTEASTRWVSQASRPARVGEFERVKEQYERRHGVELRSAGRYEPMIQYKRGAVRGERDNGGRRSSRARRGPEDRGMKLARMIAKFQPAGRRMKPEEKLEWRLGRLRWALDRDGIPYREAFREVLVEQMIKEDHRSDAARYRRAYGSSRDARGGRY
jgi:hypothetical protein